ncbi:hypothetical protein IM543_16485 [Massilia sp. UMI-21]|nr:hypothetical protein IM543_16485 [Massilia sp. UMI-21]
MNNVNTKTQAGVATASGDRMARVFRHGVLACVLACTGAAAVAAGQDRSPRREELQQQRFDTRAQDARDEQRAYEMQMREDARRRDLEEQVRAQQRDDPRRSGRMTPDERRDLRRQINEAGMDLYPNARRR